MNLPDSLDPGRTPDHPGALDLESFAFDDELTHRGSPLASHVDGCQRCRETVLILRSGRQAFLARKPAAAFLASVAQARPPGLWDRIRAGLSVPRLVMTGAIALALAVVPVIQVIERNDGAVKLKGAEAVRFGLLLSRGGSKAAPFNPKDPLHPGDVLRFEVDLPVAGYVFVANLDDQGRFAQYFPRPGAPVAPLAAGHQILPGSTLLDDFAGEEEITLFISQTPLSAESVREALTASFESAGHRLSRIEGSILGARTASIRIRKEQP